MLSGVGHPPGHHPSPRAWYIEEGDDFFPPWFSFRLLQSLQAFSAALRIKGHELPTDLAGRQWSHADVDTQDRPKPQIFTDALMHHVLVNAAPPRVTAVRPDWKMLVFEHTPDTDDLHQLGFVGLQQKIVCPDLSHLL